MTFVKKCLSHKGPFLTSKGGDSNGIRILITDRCSMASTREVGVFKATLGANTMATQAAEEDLLHGDTLTKAWLTPTRHLTSGTGLAWVLLNLLAFDQKRSTIKQKFSTASAMA